MAESTYPEIFQHRNHTWERQDSSTQTLKHIGGLGFITAGNAAEKMKIGRGAWGLHRIAAPWLPSILRFSVGWVFLWRSSEVRYFKSFEVTLNSSKLLLWMGSPKPNTELEGKSGVLAAIIEENWNLTTYWVAAAKLSPIQDQIFPSTLFSMFSWDWNFGTWVHPRKWISKFYKDYHKLWTFRSELAIHLK